MGFKAPHQLFSHDTHFKLLPFLRHRVLAKGERAPLSDPAHYVLHQNGSVTIINVSNRDTGPHVCFVWNRAGSAIRYIDLFNARPCEFG